MRIAAARSGSPSSSGRRERRRRSGSESRAAALQCAHCRMSALYLLCLIMSRGFRDVVLVACALICAAAAIYAVYNIEVFKHRYELQILGQPEQQQ